MKTNWPSRVRATARSRSFRTFLQSQFDSRRRRNPRYSLRAFARDLEIDHSTLSQILRGRRSVTNDMVERIGERIGLSRELIEGYMASGGSAGGELTRDEQRSLQISVDAFEVISDWHHFALLELTRVEGFRPDSRWIARALGITTDAVNVALSRLTRLELLEMRERDRWIDRSGNAAMNRDDLADAALRRIHRETHELAIEAIEQTPATLRDQASITVAINSAKLPRIASLVAKFRRELETLVNDGEPKDDVYMVEVSVFPVTTLNQKKENRNA
jgi:transcriptional regulator with XRE-family HTH domain